MAIAYLLLTIPQVVMIESFLSFLGLGVQEPMTSLGILLKDLQGLGELPLGRDRTSVASEPWLASLRSESHSGPPHGLLDALKRLFNLQD